MSLSKPVLFVTGHAPFDRVGAFAALHELEGIEVALFGGRSKHGAAPQTGELAFPHRHVAQRSVARLAASGRYRAVVCSAGGRIALPGAWAGARLAGKPLILWSALWAHPISPAHAFSFLALRRLYRSADALVTYGPHVSAYVKARGARNIFVAPQSVDNAFWSSPEVSAPAAPWPADAEVKFLFAGRHTREKGLRVLLQAWRASGLAAPTAALVLAGGGSDPPWIPAGGAVGPWVQSDRSVGSRVFAGGAARSPVSEEKGAVDGARTTNRTDPADAQAPGIVPIGMATPVQMRNFYEAADVLVVPSIRTRTFREPWGLVVNEAMNRKLAVIVSDAVGAAAGGLVKDGRNGLVGARRRRWGVGGGDGAVGWRCAAARAPGPGRGPGHQGL